MSTTPCKCDEIRKLEQQRDAMLEAAQKLIKAHRITNAKPPKTVMQAERQLDEIRRLVSEAEASMGAIAKAKEIEMSSRSVWWWIKQPMEAEEAANISDPIGEVSLSAIYPDSDGLYHHEFISDTRVPVQAELFIRPQVVERAEPVYMLWRHPHWEIVTKDAYEEDQGVKQTLYTSPQPVVPDGYCVSVVKQVHPLEAVQNTDKVLALLANPPSAQQFNDPNDYYQYWWDMLLEAAAPEVKP